jgi:hypothetical protein
MTSINDLERDLLYTLNADRSYILGANYPEDQLHEYCDNAVPIYYGQLADALADDTSLAVPDDNIYAGQADVNVWEIISWSIYERLSAAAHQWLYEQQATQEAAE